MVVPPSPEEARLYELVTAFVAERYDAGGQLLLESLQRQAGSNPQALCRSAGRALAAENRWGAQDRQELMRIQEVAAGIREGGKAAQLGKMLAARQGKVVLFTEFIPPLDHLGQICRRHGVACVQFSGELSRAEKDAAIARFRDEVDVLLSIFSTLTVRSVGCLPACGPGSDFGAHNLWMPSLHLPLSNATSAASRPPSHGSGPAWIAIPSL